MDPELTPPARFEISDEYWESCRDDGFVYKRSKCPRVNEENVAAGESPNPPETIAGKAKNPAEEEEINREEGKRKTLSVSSSEMNPHAVEETIRAAFKVDKASGSRRVTRSSTCGAMRNPSPAASSHGRDIVVEASKVPITEIETPEAAPEERSERVDKRKRGRPRKSISTEPTEQTCDVVNGSKAATVVELVVDSLYASWIQWQCASRSPDPIVVDKLLDIMGTSPVENLTLSLPFEKTSPCWELLESMEIFKVVPQRPHFSPLLECEEDSREGDAIGAMVNFTVLVEKANKIRVYDPISVINTINESFLKLEKHGFNVKAHTSRIQKLLSLKGSQRLAVDELQAFERENAEKDNKRRKCEEDVENITRKIAELERQAMLINEVKVTLDKEIALDRSRAAALDQKVANIEQEFQATVSAPWS